MFFRGERSPTTSANARSSSPGGASGATVVRCVLMPFGTTSHLSAHARSRTPSRVRVARLTATRRVASASDRRNWAGSSRRFATEFSRRA